MKTMFSEKVLYTDNTGRIEGVQVGRIVNVDPGKGVFVDFPGNSHGPVAARIATSVKRIIMRSRKSANLEVLLVFENNNPEYPIIIDTMEERADLRAAVSDSKDRPVEAIIDGERIVLEAGREIMLKCGKSSITLTRAGKIIIRGAYILNRSSGANKIKGASIELN